MKPKTRQFTIRLARIISPLLAFLLSYVTQAHDDWKKLPEGAVLNGVKGTWNNHAYQPSVLYENGIYKMWYTADNSQYCDTRIAYAVSEDGINWKTVDKQTSPKESSGRWDKYKCNVRVIRVKDTLKMWYTGYYYDLLWPVPRIGYAWSINGTDWNFHPDPVLDKGKPETFDDLYVFCPSVIYDGSQYHMWYSARSARNDFNVGHATSKDGIHWNKDYDNSPVINSVGKYGWYCHGVHYAHVIKYNEKYYMWFGASGYDWEKSIGQAVSEDGIKWEVDPGEVPVVECGDPEAWDGQQVQHPFVMIDNGQFKMWYSGSNKREGRWQIGLVVCDLGEEYESKDDVLPSLSMTANPNPFSSRLIVTCNFQEQTNYKLEVLTLNGQQVTILYEGSGLPGTYYYHYNSAGLTPGIYFLVLETPFKIIREKMIKVP